jgi:hypothetical protein
VRAAVKHFLRQESTEESTTETIQNITKALFQKKSIKTKVNWDELRRKARSDTGLSPEEEVMQYRRRRL